MLPDSMKLSPKFSVRPFGMHPVHSPSAAETSGEVGERFFWKGWTKGGGEPVSPAARISQAPTVLPAVTTLPANVDRVGPTVVQTQTPTPAAPVPNAWAVLEPKVALAPVGAAIQRLVAQGQEQLSVTIRFEQGGSLSVRLGMQNGEIAARIQTDVAGLDKALKSGWGEFAQDWNGRGIKLAVPVITASANAHSHGEQSPNGSTHRDGHHRGQEFSEAREERGSFDRGFQSRRHPRGQQANVETVVKNATSKTNRAQRNLGALQTWA
jgi:hypothetical protein